MGIATLQDIGLSELKTFAGTISAVGKVTPLTFRARIEASGEVKLDIDEIQVTQETVFIMTHWHGPNSTIGYFVLTGIADDRTEFKTESLHLHSLEQRSDFENGCRMRPVGTCTHAVIRRQLLQRVSRPIVRVHLKGFKNFRQLKSECEIGTIVMVGQTNKGEPDTLTGYLAVEASEENVELGAWRKSADALIEHVRRVMSFASAVLLKAQLPSYIVANSWSSKPGQKLRK